MAPISRSARRGWIGSEPVSAARVGRHCGLTWTQRAHVAQVIVRGVTQDGANSTAATTRSPARPAGTVPGDLLIWSACYSGWRLLGLI